MIGEFDEKLQLNTITRENLFSNENIGNNDKNIIRIKFSILPLHILSNIIDNCILILQNKNAYKPKIIYPNKIIEIQTYFIRMCLKENCMIIPKIYNIDLIPKKQNLLDLYYRISDNNYLLLNSRLYSYMSKKNINNYI